MKKLIIAVAVVLTAGLMTSCGNSEKCYKIQATSGENVVTTYVWGTKADVDVAKEKLSATMTLIGADVKFTTNAVSKSQEDCK